MEKEFDKNCSKFIKMNMFNKIFNAVININKPSFFAIRSSLRFSYNLIKIIKTKKIDVIHAEYTSMGQYIWIKRLFPTVQFNLVEHDVTIQSYKRKENIKGLLRYYWKWQTSLVYKCEKKYCQGADVLFTLNKKDKRLLMEIYNRADVQIIVPYYGLNLNNVNRNVEKIPKSICFIGQMSREENNLAAKRLIKIFKSLEKNKDYKLYIIGAHPSNEVLACASKNIIVTGFVDIIEDYINKCEIAVFPLDFGAGIKLKVLLACGLGLPVITTDIGAEGIDEDGEVLILAKSNDDFKREITRLLNDEEKINDISVKSLKYVNDHFGWWKSEKLLKEIYK